ncbi:hypothetical protein C8Q80DRAFT_1275666 [Daedaleopsis nitida]|nr:hypothetical protein C8Q80DRAFT_1275666 [Daedaleopsis nitida]
MSSNIADPETIALYQSLFVETLCNRATATLFLYDYIITFGREVEFFWRAKPTGATAIFLSNRYLYLTITVYTMMINIAMSDALYCGPKIELCSGRDAVHSMGSKVVGIAVLLLAMGTVGINFAMLPYITGENDPDTGCTGADSLTLSMAKTGGSFDHPPSTLSQTMPIIIATIVSRTCQIASDAAVIIITWTAVSRKRINAVRWLSPLSLADVILRDGTVYFLVLLILNSLQLTFTLLSMNIAFENVSYFSIFTEPLTSILVSRYLLDLQAASTRECNLANGSDDGEVVMSSAYQGSSMLDRFVGSLGSSLYISETVEEGIDIGPQLVVDSEADGIGATPLT